MVGLPAASAVRCLLRRLARIDVPLVWVNGRRGSGGLSLSRGLGIPATWGYWGRRHCRRCKNRGQTVAVACGLWPVPGLLLFAVPVPCVLSGGLSAIRKPCRARAAANVGGARAGCWTCVAFGRDRATCGQQRWGGRRALVRKPPPFGKKSLEERCWYARVDLHFGPFHARQQEGHRDRGSQEMDEARDHWYVVVAVDWGSIFSHCQWKEVGEGGSTVISGPHEKCPGGSCPIFCEGTSSLAYTRSCTCFFCFVDGWPSVQQVVLKIEGPTSTVYKPTVTMSRWVLSGIPNPDGLLLPGHDI